MPLVGGIKTNTRETVFPGHWHSLDPFRLMRWSAALLTRDLRVTDTAAFEKEDHRKDQHDAQKQFQIESAVQALMEAVPTNESS